MGNDRFIEIAKQKIIDRKGLLIKPPPLKFEKKSCTLEKTSDLPVKTTDKVSTKQELFCLLEKMRKEYKPYLENHAPVVTPLRSVIPITEFMLDGKKITVPHYGDPVGYAKKEYTTEFNLDNFDGKAVFICFKGADYKTAVLVNNKFAGAHEGFFSPFEFEITDIVKEGKNTLEVVLENDFVYRGNTTTTDTSGEEAFEGDKLYAATGIGFDNSESGWHHCPPGMGIYNSVYVEIREKSHISDIYVRPDIKNGSAEIWVEIENTQHLKKEISFDVSLYGQNFNQTIYENIPYKKDSSCNAFNFDSSDKNSGTFAPAEYGKNMYKISINIPDAKIWDTNTPFLYQLQLSMYSDGVICDRKASTFGMREFSQDTESNPKGMFYFNGKKIRLRGANTMGFEQLDVLRGDFDQLVDDILLAKICNINFWRLTQRPVQDEIYQYCDMLGLMTQTDLPLFGVMRRNKVAEGIRQAEEMIKMVRSHPCNVVITYINEPSQRKIHRHLARYELEEFFDACDVVVRLHHPDCVIKHIDGDYNPPCKTMPDNHCYTMWYNNHFIYWGELYRGYWKDVMPGWYYGCGEHGVEGMDFPEIMRKYYPKEWLKEPFDPANVVSAQSSRCHAAFMDTPDTLEEWSFATQRHQANATKIMTEAFRRDSRMVSNAIHLFIDAWPDGWMKAIMDFKRNPKPAYFEYRNALEPIIVSLRCDKWTYYENDPVSIETYVCNDTGEEGKGYEMVHELYCENKLVMTKKSPVEFGACTSTYVGSAEFIAQTEKDRQKYTLKAILIKNGEVCNYNTFDIEVFKKREIKKHDNVVFITDLEDGEHEIAGETVVVENLDKRFDNRYFISRKTGHPFVSEFLENDFSMWYDEKEDIINPVLDKAFSAKGFTPILTAGKGRIAAGIKEYEGKKYVICFVRLRMENPVAERFLSNIYNGTQN